MSNEAEDNNGINFAGGLIFQISTRLFQIALFMLFEG